MNQQEIILTKLVTNEGKILSLSGVAIEGDGIFDLDYNSYPAGYDAEGTLYACMVDTDEIVINLLGERMETFKISV